MRALAALLLALTLATASQALGFKPIHLSITGNGPNRAKFLYLTTTSQGQVREYPEQEVSLDYETVLRLESGMSIVVVAQSMSETGSITVQLATEGVHPQGAQASSSGPYGVAKTRFVVP